MFEPCKKEDLQDPESMIFLFICDEDFEYFLNKVRDQADRQTEFIFLVLVDSNLKEDDLQETLNPRFCLSADISMPPRRHLANPSILKTSVQTIMAGFQDLLKGATSDNPTDLETARQRMQSLRHYLETQGITVSDEFDTLPDKLRERCQTATTDPELKESAQKFVEATEEVKQSFSTLLQTLKSGAEKLREVLDEVNGRE